MKKALLILVMMMLVIQFVACDDDDDNTVVKDPVVQTFVSLESPYAVCATRNPGGVGFDFEYSGEEGGANNLDDLSVDDFSSDLTIKTVKSEKPDGTLGGVPYIELKNGAQSINYSSINAECKGLAQFTALAAENLAEFTFMQDAEDFDLSDLPTGETGKPLMSDVQAECAKLVMGIKWKSSANNDVDADELVWIVKTSEGRLVKLIVTQFPAVPAPAITGYIALEWAFLD